MRIFLYFILVETSPRLSIKKSGRTEDEAKSDRLVTPI